MAEIVYMPKLSDTMTEGVVAEWTKKVGDKVASGEVLAEIETDKATMEFESFFDGVLLHIGVEKGKSAPVNSILAIIGQQGEDISALLAGAPAPAPAKEESVPAPVASAPAAVPTPAPVSAPVEAAPAAVPASNTSGRVLASPLAKKMAQEKGIDIASVPGSGEAGRIVKRDVDHYVPYTAPASAPMFSAPAGTESFEDETVSQMRKTIARRLAESKFTAPHFYLTLDIDMDNAIAARKSLNSTEGVKVSFNDMVVTAVAMSVRQHPAVNSAWLGDVIRRNHHVHIGVAVAV
ncbi:MAG: dihydrolipoamide acetyltransferase family protein, partial [Flavobacteriia bacterium]